MFRDESQDVVRKAKKASPPGRSPKTSKKTSRAPSPVGSARTSPSLELVAEKEYGSALEHMAAAVSNDVEAKSNPTLASVLLLAIFELIVNSSISNNSWSQCRGIHPYGNQYHSYRDFRVSNVWNQYRCARILNCEIILNCLGKLSSKSATGWSTELKSHMSSLRVTARQMAIDICATIPFHFGAGAPNDSEESFVPDNESYIGGLVIQWPLFIAAASEAKNHPLRKWVIGCLKAIGHTMGINQAFAVVDIVRTAKGFFDKTDQEDSLFIEDVLRSDELTEILGQQTSPLDF
ncbi:hypothetical protein MW887_009689 [Aspergillus wentii]|nr:hypothetical protein MW887_009689 [Aspergillus wentii]